MCLCVCALVCASCGYSMVTSLSGQHGLPGARRAAVAMLKQGQAKNQNDREDQVDGTCHA